MAQNVYTIQNNDQIGDQRRRSSNSMSINNNDQDASSLLIDTNSIPLTQQPLQPMPVHQHALQPQQLQQQQPQQQQQVICSQPSSAPTTSRVAPESQGIVYSVHPTFSSLDALDALFVKQKVDCERTCCGFESTNAYTVRSKGGEPILRAVENSSCCERCCFEGNREYSLKLVFGDEVVARVVKPYRVSRFCCYSNAVRVESPEDNPIGTIKQLFTLFGHPKYAVFDSQFAANKAMFIVESMSCRFCCNPCLSTCFCPNRGFHIMSATQTDESGKRRQVATISRNCEPPDASWTKNNAAGSQNLQQDQQAAVDDQQIDEGCESPTTRQVRLNTADGCQVFGIQFDANLEARHKVLLLAACFMMDFFYFESDRRRKKLTKC